MILMVSSHLRMCNICVNLSRNLLFFTNTAHVDLPYFDFFNELNITALLNRREQNVENKKFYKFLSQFENLKITKKDIINYNHGLTDLSTRFSQSKYQNFLDYNICLFQSFNTFYRSVSLFSVFFQMLLFL